MQDAENVAAPEAAEERAEPARQQPVSESPPTDEAAGSGGSEVGRTEDAEEDAEARPEPEVRAKPAAQSEEETAASPAASPTPQSAQEPSAPGKAEAGGEQARHPSARAEEEGGSDGSAAEAEPRALENGEADEPSFSDPEDFVDDVSEEELLGDVLKDRPQEADGIDSVIVVDNVPQVGPDRLEKLKNVIHKIFSKFGKIINDYYPEEDGKTKG